MRFVFSVALKYLIPRWRQLSVSIISLISVLVISMVVWLVLVFLSVTEGIEKNWIKQLISLNAPLRLTPTEAYYSSYYYLIDTVSSASEYSGKTIGEKLRSPISDPYDEEVDVQVPASFPPALRHSDGRLVDLAKEAWELIAKAAQTETLQPEEFEVNFGNIRLAMIRDGRKTFLNQPSYIASEKGFRSGITPLLLSPTETDLNNLLLSFSLAPQAGLSEEEYDVARGSSEAFVTNLKRFFEFAKPTQLKPTSELYPLPEALYPRKALFKAYWQGDNRLVIPQLAECGNVELAFDEGRPSLPFQELLIQGEFPLQAALCPASLEKASSLSDVRFKVQGMVQGVELDGEIAYEHLEITKARPLASLWASGFSCSLGEGVLVSKQLQSHGVRAGDLGFISYYAQTLRGVQEMRLPIYVLGFYDPGLLPMGSKLLFASEKVAETLRSPYGLPDKNLGNGILVRTPHLRAVGQIKETIEKGLKERGLDKYWEIEAFTDYDFARPILQQLSSDKTLFTLIATIILIVACSNIVSMLILLVNDKKREIGILQSMGATPWQIAAIFGTTGCLTGLLSSLLGLGAALFTLRHLHVLVNFLSFLQGHEAFQSAFYGQVLPSDLSMHALFFVLISTTLIAILAGTFPAIKAARLKPSEILRAE